MRDPYDVLGVKRSASAAELKAVFQNLVRKLHPDAIKCDPAMASRFAEINAAYEILGDKDKRKAFDSRETESEDNAHAPAPEAPAAPVAGAQTPFSPHAGISPAFPSFDEPGHAPPPWPTDETFAPGTPCVVQGRDGGWLAVLSDGFWLGPFDTAEEANAEPGPGPRPTGSPTANDPFDMDYQWGTGGAQAGTWYREDGQGGRWYYNPGTADWDHQPGAQQQQATQENPNDRQGGQPLCSQVAEGQASGSTGNAGTNGDVVDAEFTEVDSDELGSTSPPWPATPVPTPNKSSPWSKVLLACGGALFVWAIYVHRSQGVTPPTIMTWLIGFVPTTLIIPFIIYEFFNHEVAEWAYERSHGKQGSSAAFGLFVDTSAMIGQFGTYVLLIAYLYDQGWQKALGLYVITLLASLPMYVVPVLLKRTETLFLLFRLLCLGVFYVTLLYISYHLSWFGLRSI